MVYRCTTSCNASTSSPGGSWRKDLLPATRGCQTCSRLWLWPPQVCMLKPGGSHRGQGMHKHVDQTVRLCIDMTEALRISKQRPNDSFCSHVHLYMLISRHGLSVCERDVSHRRRRWRTAELIFSRGECSSFVQRFGGSCGVCLDLM